MEMDSMNLQREESPNTNNLKQLSMSRRPKNC